MEPRLYSGLLTVKYAGNGRARKKCRGKQETQSNVFLYFLRALALPKCFRTEQTTVDAFSIYDEEFNIFLTHSAKISKRPFFSKKYKWRQWCSVL